MGAYEENGYEGNKTGGSAMRTGRYRIGRFRFASKLQIAVTAMCMVMGIVCLAGSFINPVLLLYAAGSIALVIACYHEEW
jgi:endonuclease/exonuclease/phosphatase (EEP) superfamily protein YafD